MLRVLGCRVLCFMAYIGVFRDLDSIPNPPTVMLWMGFGTWNATSWMLGTLRQTLNPAKH